MPELEALDANGRGGMVFGTNRSRLALAMRHATTPEATVTFDESPDLIGHLRGVGLDNPYGSSLRAYEPGTVMFDGVQESFDGVMQKRAQDAAQAQTTTSLDFSQGAPLGDATGKLGAAINAALALAQRRVPYVWGGTTANGVDCSGLIYYAFRAAGIDTKRYRAVDYGTMGQQVSAQEARPGDLVYWDNPNTSTDHIGIYLGNGKVVQAPQSGDVVKVSNVWQSPPPTYRRIFDDGAFAQIATPEGGAYWAYGSQAQTWANTPTAPTPTPTTIRRTQASTSLLRRKMEF